MVAITVESHPLEPTRFNNIIKSSTDKREYRGLILHNKLKVLLISDSTTDKSAASLDVNVGQLSDPKGLPGLAHFCEHMLFLGTAKYPEVNNYNQYLSHNGGASNAATYLDHTNYYFDVNPENLEGALDRFSQFFLCPLFTESMTEKEINSIQLEYEMRLPNDEWRVIMLDKSSADPNHPYSDFGIGNKETLFVIPQKKNINVRQALLDFHNTWYSANIMSLCVLGRESLDELEDMVVQMFSDIENKNVEAPVWTEHPFTEEHFKMKWSVVPVKDVRILHITFPIPDLRRQYRAAPMTYWSHLIGHEGKGSLISALKKKGWGDLLLSYSRKLARGFGFFHVDVDLTEEGLLHVDDIVTMIFQYINMLKMEGLVKWIFDEYSDIFKMNFRFFEKNPAIDYVKLTAEHLQNYPIEEVISAPLLISEWRSDLINDAMTYLKPENIRVCVAAKAFENEADSVEPWFGTKFKKERIPDELIAKWSNAGINEAFHLPERNEFIPSKFDIKPYDEVDEFPVIIEDNPLLRVWFKPGINFIDPKAKMIFYIVSPMARIDPISSNMTNMFVDLVTDSMNEYCYNAKLTGLEWELYSNQYGLILEVAGYDHKLDVLLEKILDEMVNFHVDERRFEILKESYIRRLKNIELDELYDQVREAQPILLTEQAWTRSEILDACPMLTAGRMQRFISIFMSKLHVEGLIYGNFTKTEALTIIETMGSKLASVENSTPLLPRQLVLYRELQLPNGSHFLYEIENKHHKSSCTLVYYQTGLRSTESNMLLELFTQIAWEPCFSILRTKEQLGYVLLREIIRTNDAQGFRIIVQSNRHPHYVEGRIDAFMESMKEYIANMSEEEFNAHKESLATRRLEQSNSMSGQMSMYEVELFVQQYNFDRASIEVAYLRTITKQQILDFLKDMMLRDSPRRRKLSIHMVSNVEGAQENDLTSEHVAEKSAAVRIGDVLEFKTSLPLQPLLEPFNGVPRKGTRQ